MNRSGLASVCLLVSLASSSLAWAQETPPPPPPPPPPADTAAAPAAPADAGASAEGNIDVGAGANAEGSASAAPAAAPASSEAGAPDEDDKAKGAADPNAERNRRMASLHESNSLDASTGLWRVIQASSGAPGTFRMSIAGSYFSTSGFLCNSSTPCPTVVDNATSASNEDSVDRVGMRLGVSATLFPFLEAAFSMRNMATSDSRSRPKLLQVLGDSTLAIKAFMPVEPDQIFQFGGLAQLLLENGAGSVGFAGSGTSFDLKALGTVALDNRSNPDDVIPLRFHANVGWLFDNSAALVKAVETTPPPAGRGENIQRTERFGLDINRVDSFQLGLGGEFIHEFVRPFVEWTWDIPVNRQKYVCDENEAAAHGELCLAKAQGWATTPSRLSLGARVFPWPERGLSGLLAVDIGTGATSKFIDEVAPEPPYDLWFGVAWAVDTEPPAPIIKEVEKPSAGPAVAKVNPYLSGTVVDKAGNGVGGATLRFDGRSLPGMLSADDGTFKSFSLEPGTYTLAISAHGYHDGQCAVTVPTEQEMQAATAPNPAMPPAEGSQAAPAVAADGAVSVRCELEALPQLGNVVGQVVDAASQQSIGGAHVKIRDTRSRELDLTADATGSFRFQNVPPGRVTIIVDAPGYFTATQEFTIKPLEDIPAHMLLNKRPAVPNVLVTSRELKLRQQVHFQHDSAEILPDSSAILEEIADVLNTHPEIKGIEVQGHTDNQGSAPYNLKLSESRAQAVVDALVKLGVDPLRLQAKGYGDTKPLLPNSTEVNRAKNRRVQLMVKKD
ncbi:MAG TPA: OmpA family protein [Polyangiaceae bacterium]|nr:OmpA family protein [Polyangiaceae bacterium]